ncbi:hypothetical protein [Methylobacterium sp. SD21]|uniref:hypothetical protein n=1 Tax=Methylobacterium litchii TaxID=3138810 RepID=UPI00313E0580
MPDLTAPLFVASGFVGIGWLIIRADREYTDAIRHTLTIFALVLTLLVTAGVMAKLRAAMGAGRMSHRVEARSQVERPSAVARKP